MDTQQVWHTLTDVGLRIALQVVGALIVFLVNLRFARSKAACGYAISQRFRLRPLDDLLFHRL